MNNYWEREAELAMGETFAEKATRLEKELKEEREKSSNFIDVYERLIKIHEGRQERLKLQIETLKKNQEEVLRMLLRVYLATHRQGYEKTETEREVLELLHDMLANYQIDPESRDPEEEKRIQDLLENR